MERILLHICCGPCATSVLESLIPRYEVTGYFCNPNIAPEGEYSRRLDAASEVCRRFGVPLVEEPPNTREFDEAVRGLEREPENGARCLVCYALRLEKAARLAARGYGLFATTLTVGPMKKAVLINPIGEEKARAAGVGFLAEDWKKRDGFRRSCQLSREFGITRQHYCGCTFSIRNAPPGRVSDLSAP
jgi:epoxyqueuosine reductase